MFDNVVKALASQNSGIDLCQWVFIEGNLTSDSNLLVPYLIKYFLRDIGDAQPQKQEQKKILLFNFDDSLGLINNLCRHVGVNQEIEHKNHKFEAASIAEYINDWINYDQPMITTTTSLWKQFGNFGEIFRKNKGDLHKILGDVQLMIEKAENAVVFLTGQHNLANVVEESQEGVLYAFIEQLLGQTQNLSKNNTNIVISVNGDSIDEDHERLLNILRQESDLQLLFLQNQGGYSKDITGQLKIIIDNSSNTVSTNDNDKNCSVKSKVIKYNVKDTEIDFFETYIVK